MKHILFTLVSGFVFSTSSAAFADGASAHDPLISDSRIKTLTYHENDVYVIYTLYGYQTNVEFSRREEIEAISIGDHSLWQIIPAGYRLFIRPMEDDVSTNMTVITNRRTYQFDLKSGKGKRENNPELVYVARFSYPDEKPKAQPVALVPVTPALAAAAPAPVNPPAAVPVAVPGDAPALNYLYTYAGVDAYAPEQVYDDGRSTYMRFRDMTQPLPKVYIPDGHGGEVQVPVVLRNGFMVVSVVAPRLALAFDAQRVTLYNEMLNAGL